MDSDYPHWQLHPPQEQPNQLILMILFMISSFFTFITYNQINNFNYVGPHNRLPLHPPGQVLSEAGGGQVQEAHAVRQIHQPRQEYRNSRLAN